MIEVQNKSTAAAASNAADAADEVFVFPTSFAQQRLWFLDQFEPGSPFYNIPSAVRMRGRLDVAALHRTLAAIVTRHETLRTTFTSIDGTPMQVIAPTGSCELPLVDLQHLAPAERETHAHWLINEDARRPFDLHSGPLLRSTLLRLAETEHILLLTLHHIISDGWSMGVLINEIAALYPAFVAGQPSPLPDLPIQYADFAEWQREWLQGEVLEQQLSYWRQQLSGELPVLELPTDRPRPAVQSARGGTETLHIPRRLVDQVSTLGRQSGATLFMTLLAAFQVLLARYSDQEDICVGTPVANRTRVEIEPLVGCFINTLVLRGDLGGDPDFRMLLRRVKETCLGAFANQDLPFETLVEELQPERDMSHSPLFQVVFILQNAASGQSHELPDLTLEQVDSDSGTATFDLTMLIGEDEQGLEVALEYSSDLFDTATVERMLVHYQTLLASIVAQPDCPISRLPLLSPAERAAVLTLGQGPVAPLPPVTALHQLVALHAASRPEATAVVAGPDQFSYADLEAYADRVAHQLLSAGLRPGQLVAIALERNALLPVAVLAVWKAGAAFVPIDLSTPTPRLAAILADAAPAFLLIGPGIDRFAAGGAEAVPIPPATRLMLIDSQPAPDDLSIAAPPAAGQPEQPAYLIYTSGSTGTPKGVLVEQRQLLNAYAAWQQAYALQPGMRHLQMASFGFDVFVGDLVRALGSGGCLILCPRETLLDPPALAGLIDREQIACAEFVPAVLRGLMAHLESAATQLDCLQLVICGSDTWYAGEYAHYQRLLGPTVRLINSFGLTEATIDSTYLEAGSRLNLTGDQILPIGRPYANMQAYILDPAGEPLPIGVPGELYIGGAGIARGYHNQPALTAERFLPDPFAAEPGARMYRSGDRARFLSDGTIAYLGRADSQVKIRGFRIEPGEIEAVLGRHPALHQVAVVPQQAPGGETWLVAYLTTDGARPTTGELRRFAQERLPNYMLPALFVQLAVLPLLPNGKIDRRALPEPDWSARQVSNAYVAPRTVEEAQLVRIWGELLGLDRVSVHDDFFALGGHSLLATQLISRIRAVCKIELPLRSVFEAPTLAEFAEQIAVARRGGDDRAVPPIRPLARPALLPLSFAQQRLWFLDQLEPGNPFYNIPETMRLQGPLDVAALTRSLNEIVRRHESLRTVFAAADGQPYQRILPTLAIELPLSDLSHLPAAEREAEAWRLATREARRSFDLQHGPLLRARLLRLASDDHIVLLTVHHIVSDQWSTNVLVSEIAAIYDAFARGRPTPLPALPIQYADFALWQRNWLQGETLERQLSYWRDHLTGAPPLLELPTDRPRPPVQTYNGSYIDLVLPRKLTYALKTLGQREGATLFMTVLAAFNVLLARYSGQDDICIGTPIANRHRGEVENLIGFFINTLVLRSDLSDEPDFLTLLRRTREATLSAYAHQDLPFEMLVDALQPERDQSHSPLFQVMFALQNAPLQLAELNDLALSDIDVHSGTAKFDLTLFLTEAGDELSGALEYNTDLFERATVERMAGHFRLLLQAIVDNPVQPVTQLSFLPAAERELLLATWNQTTAPYPSERCVHQLFVEQVLRTPTTTAVTYADQHISYAELDTRANQLAHLLQQHGAGPDILIGICLVRSIEMVVACLSVLKAGAAYVPIDPTYPAERVAFMLADARPAVLLTAAAAAAALDLPALTAASETTLLYLDGNQPLLAGQPATSPACPLTPDHLAYVIYTSGSTGRPKGAMITHRGLVNYLWWALHTYPRDGRGAPVHSSLSFDLTVTSLYLPLLSGGRVDLLPAERDIEALAAALSAPGDYSLVKITPAHLELLNQQLTPATAARSTRGFIIGGENLLSETLAFWRTHAPQTLLVNEYGPTETVVGCCVYCVGADDPLNGSVPIGRPIANTRLYVLDRHCQPVPLGVIGELYIGGAGVARGYLNRPELSAERFLPDPFVAEPGAHMYKTGDLVRYRPDGVLEYLGRTDHQVKIRGFRIELGEIESAIGAHPHVREVVVLAREDTPGNKRLVAYLKPDAAAPAAHELPAVLRADLPTRLPEYMLPVAFVVLDQLPLTTNGKVDRRALPAPEADRSMTGADYTAPRDQVETILAAIWGQVLGLEQVGVHDNFFALGGDSIISLQVVARANQAGLRLAPRHIFAAPTIAELARLAGSGPAINAEQGLVSGSLPLTPIQHWFFALDLPRPQHWNQSLLLETHVPLDRDLLETAVERLLAHHDALRLRFHYTAQGWQGWHAPLTGDTPVEWISLRATDPAAQLAALEQHAAAIQAGLDLEHGPLLRVAYFDCGPNRAGRLLIVIHHLVVDGVSWRIILEDLHTIYDQLQHAASARLPFKTSSFQAWATRLADYAANPELQSAFAYWANQRRPHLLPCDFPDGANNEASTAVVTVALTAAETHALLHDVPVAYRAEINAVLLTALARALAGWMGVDTLHIDVESHGRADIFADLDVSRTVGWFTALYPIELTLPAGDDPVAALHAIKAQLRAVPQHGLGYGLLRYSNAAPASAGQVVAEPAAISFNYLGQFDQALPAGELFAIAAESSGPERDPHSPRTHLIDINGSVAGGQLAFEWSYSSNLHRPASIEQVAVAFGTELRRLIALSHSAETSSPAAADVAAFGWDEADLAGYLAEIEGEAGA